MKRLQLRPFSDTLEFHEVDSTWPEGLHSNVETELLKRSRIPPRPTVPSHQFHNDFSSFSSGSIASENVTTDSPLTRDSSRGGSNRLAKINSPVEGQEPARFFRVHREFRHSFYNYNTIAVTSARGRQVSRTRLEGLGPKLPANYRALWLSL